MFCECGIKCQLLVVTVCTTRTPPSVLNSRLVHAVWIHSLVGNCFSQCSVLIEERLLGLCLVADDDKVHRWRVCRHYFCVWVLWFACKGRDWRVHHWFPNHCYPSRTAFSIVRQQFQDMRRFPTGTRKCGVEQCVYDQEDITWTVQHSAVADD